MLFPYHFDSPLTPSAVKIQRENLKELIANRTQFCDDLLKQLWQQFGLDKANLTLIAVGGMAEQCGGSFALLLKGGNAAGENGFGNQSQRNAQIQSVDACPFAGAFLSGGIEYFVYQRQAV